MPRDASLSTFQNLDGEGKEQEEREEKGEEEKAGETVSGASANIVEESVRST